MWGSESERDLLCLVREGGRLPGGLGGRRGAGVRGGMMGAPPSSPHSVERSRGGTGGTTSLGLGGGGGTSDWKVGLVVSEFLLS